MENSTEVKTDHLIKKHLGPIHVQGIYDQQASEESLQHEGQRPRQTNVKKDASSSRSNEESQRKK